MTISFFYLLEREPDAYLLLYFVEHQAVPLTIDSLLAPVCIAPVTVSYNISLFSI